MDSTLNLYHQWTYLNEIENAINQNVSELSEQLGLPISAIKIIRTLTLLDGVSIAILDSFTHPDHPEQIDNHKKLEWITSLREILHKWHEVFHLFLQQQLQSRAASNTLQEKLSITPPTKNILHRLNRAYNNKSFTEEKNQLKKMWSYWAKKHAALLFPQKNLLSNWRHLQSSLTQATLLQSITSDQKLDPVKQKYAHIEPFFRGIHQMIEIAMNVVVDFSNQLQHDIANLKTTSDQTALNPLEYDRVILLRTQMQQLQKWWEIAAAHIMLLNKMDTGSYAEYRQALLGTSGGDSKQLRQLKTIMTHLHFALPGKLCDHALQFSALHKISSDPLLNQLLSAIRETQAASADFWMRHFTLTANTIGMIRGSQGLPVEKLLAFAVNPLLSKESLLQIIGKVGHYYAQSPEAVVVQIDQQREKIIGKTIFSHVKNKFNAIREYHTLTNQQEALLDAFELRPLEPNDTKVSPYAAWFHPDAHNMGLRFEMHSFGTPLILMQESIAKTTQRITELQNHYWQLFFSERFGQLQTVLFKLLEIPTDQFFGVAIDHNVTALLERLISSLPADQRDTVLTTDQEFLTVQRTLATGVNANQFKIEKLTLNPESLNLAESFIQGIQKIGRKLKLVIFSQVMSNSQISMTPQEITQILDATPTDVPVIIDTTQGIFNVPIAWGTILKNRPNVYLLGSAIKHGRSTAGLGLLIYPQKGLLHHPKISGWCAYLSGLSSGQTTDTHGKLLYDEPLQWLGGTPGNFFTVDLFINTWDAILRTGETLKSMHQYVNQLHGLLLQHAKINLTDQSRRAHYPEYSSNTIVLKLSNENAHQLVQKAAQKNLYFDCRTEQGARLGFGIQHGKSDIEKLCEILK